MNVACFRFQQNRARAAVPRVLSPVITRVRVSLAQQCFVAVRFELRASGFDHFELLALTVAACGVVEGGSWPAVVDVVVRMVKEQQGWKEEDIFCQNESVSRLMGWGMRSTS